jgi:putative oxidoreductase
VLVLTYLHPITLGALRAIAAFLLWQHAARRLFGLFGGEPAPILSPVWFVGLVEYVGSIAIGVGLLTRPVAALVALEMAAVYSIVYLPRGFPPLGEQLGEVTVAIGLVCGFLAIAGAGRFSIDADLRSRRPELHPRWSGEPLEKYLPSALGVFRVLLGLLYAQHGLPKLGVGEEGADFLTQRWIAGVVELFGGSAIALGLFTRPVAFVTSGQMSFAYFLSHAPRGFFPIENGGERAALFCFFFLMLVTAGPGRWAVDGWRKEPGREQR